MKRKNFIYHVLYSIIVCFFFASILWLICRCTQPSLFDQLFADASVFESGWCTESGESVDLAKLQNMKDTKIYTEFSVYHDIPETFQEGDSLYFRSKNIFYSVYIDGTLVYEPEVPESALYTNSFGTRWNCIPLPQSDADSQIEIRITKVYESSRACIDNIYLGDSGGMILYTISNRLVAFITCMLLLFVGFLLMVADIPVNMQVQKNHELLYLGMFAVSISIWCFSETNLVQLYFDDSRMMQVVSCFSLMLIPIPLILYLEAAFGFRQKWIVPVFCAMSALNVTLCWGLHFLGIRDIHDTLFITHLMLALSAVFLIYSILRDFLHKREKHSKNIYRILRTIGLCGIGIATVIDIVRYYQGSVSDNAMFVRIGLLIFIICYGSSTLENTIYAVKRGAQAEFVKQLAYHDGLTGIGNRTAFQERLADLEKQKLSIPSIGIIMFDVNDLKFVNDNLGHSVGDCMLIKSAQVIMEAFEPLQGDCFRIGGDEFAVLLSGENVTERYQKGIEKFRTGIQCHNAETDKEFYLSIAYGYAECNEESRTSQKLDEIYTQADENMYETKKKMKASHNMKEFYANPPLAHA